MRKTAELARWCEQHQVPFVIENPQLSRCWRIPDLLALAARGGTVTVHYCRFGTPYKKPTKLLFGGPIDLSPLAAFTCSGKLCQETGLPHAILTGKNEYGVFRTAAASAYPVKLAKEVAKLLIGPVGLKNH